MPFTHTLNGTSHVFPDLRTLLAKASPKRSGEELAGICAENATERVAAQMALADVALSQFLCEAIIPYERDEVTRLIIDNHVANSFTRVNSMTVGEFRDWLLSDEADSAAL